MSSMIYVHSCVGCGREKEEIHREIVGENGIEFMAVWCNDSECVRKTYEWAKKVLRNLRILTRLQGGHLSEEQRRRRDWTIWRLYRHLDIHTTVIAEHVAINELAVKMIIAKCWGVLRY